MSLRGMKGVGIPTVMYHEAEGLVVTIETKAGMTYRGTVQTTEDSMNISLRDVMVTDTEGAVTEASHVFLRGNQIVFVIFPDVLRVAPFFKRLAQASAGIKVAGGLGRARQLAINARCTLQRMGWVGLQHSHVHTTHTHTPNPNPTHVCAAAKTRVAPGGGGGGGDGGEGGWSCPE